MRNRLGSSAVIAAVVLAAAGVPTAVFAAIESYLELDGVSGDSADPSHPGWIQVESFSWGAGAAPGMGAGAGAGARPGPRGEIVITKHLDRASPLLMRCATTGCHYRTAVLEVRKAGGELVRYTLDDVTVSKVRTSSGGDRPTESLTLNFTKVKMTYAARTGSARPPNMVMRPPAVARPH